MRRMTTDQTSRERRTYRSDSGRSTDSEEGPSRDRPPSRNRFTSRGSVEGSGVWYSTMSRPTYEFSDIKFVSYCQVKIKQVKKR